MNRRQIFQWLASLPLIGGIARAKVGTPQHDGCYQASWTVRFEGDYQEANAIAELIAQNNELLVNPRSPDWPRLPFSRYLFETRDSNGSIATKVAVVLVGRFPLSLLRENLLEKDREILAAHLKAHLGKPSLFPYNAQGGTLRDGREILELIPNPALEMTWALTWDFRDYALAEKAMAALTDRKTVGGRCVFQMVTDSGDYLPHCQSFLQRPVKISDLVAAMTKADRLAMLTSLQ